MTDKIDTKFSPWEYRYVSQVMYLKSPLDYMF